MSHLRLVRDELESNPDLTSDLIASLVKTNAELRRSVIWRLLEIAPDEVRRALAERAAHG